MSLEKSSGKLLVLLLRHNAQIHSLLLSFRGVRKKVDVRVVGLVEGDSSLLKTGAMLGYSRGGGSRISPPRAKPTLILKSKSANYMDTT